MNSPLSIKPITLSIIKCIDTLSVENESDPFPMEGHIFQCKLFKVIHNNGLFAWWWLWQIGSDYFYSIFDASVPNLKVSRVNAFLSIVIYFYFEWIWEFSSKSLNCGFNEGFSCLIISFIIFWKLFINKMFEVFCKSVKTRLTIWYFFSVFSKIKILKNYILMCVYE